MNVMLSVAKHFALFHNLLVYKRLNYYHTRDTSAKLSMKFFQFSSSYHQ